MATKSRNIGKGNRSKDKQKGIASNPSLRGRDKAKLNKFQKEELTTKIINWILDRADKSQIRDNIILHAPVSLTNDDATELIRYAIARMEEISKQDAEIDFAVHSRKYDEIANYFRSIGHAQGEIKAMKAKEKLAGIFKGKNSVTANVKKKTVITKVVEYDTSKLNPAQKIRLEELLNKMK
jgi:hypothetical protein